MTFDSIIKALCSLLCYHLITLPCDQHNLTFTSVHLTVNSIFFRFNFLSIRFSFNSIFFRFNFLSIQFSFNYKIVDLLVNKVMEKYQMVDMKNIHNGIITINNGKLFTYWRRMQSNIWNVIFDMMEIVQWILLFGCLVINRLTLRPLGWWSMPNAKSNMTIESKIHIGTKTKNQSQSDLPSNFKTRNTINKANNDHVNSALWITAMI